MEEYSEDAIAELLGESDPEDEQYRQAAEKSKKELESEKSPKKKRKYVKKKEPTAPKSSDAGAIGSQQPEGMGEVRRSQRRRVQNPIFHQFEDEDEFELRRKRRLLKKKKKAKAEATATRRNTMEEVPLEIVKRKQHTEKQKPATQKRNQRPKKSVEELTEGVVELVGKMISAAEQDAISIDNGSLAIRKLQVLPLVKSQLEKRHLNDLFIGNGFLEACKVWLDPAGQKQLKPDYSVKSSLLRIISELPVSTEILERSKIGPSILSIMNDKEEHADLRKLAGIITQKWSRMIFQLPSSYVDRESYIYDREVMERTKITRANLKNLTTYESRNKKLNARPGEAGFTYRVIQPERASFDFLRNPSSPIIDIRPERPSGSTNLTKKLQDIKKEGKPSLKRSKAEVVFVSGSEMMRS